MKKFYITTPIFYPNALPHMGHAYSVIVADIFARFHRLNNKDVFFVSGTDEHGLKMYQTAKKQGLSPLELANKNTKYFKDILLKLNISNDDFIRTTEKRHHICCQEIWKRIEKSGDIYIDKYRGWYSIDQESFYEEKDTEIDKYGTRREKELKSIVEWREEESYFFSLSLYKDHLLDFYKRYPNFIQPKKFSKEIINFVSSGLKDLSISRKNFSWGVPVPGNKNHVMYVWIDALINYLTSIKYTDKKSDKLYYWPPNIQIIGKDILRFHAIYWPAFLMSAHIEIPKKIFAHGFLFNKGAKMSKSIGNVVDPFKITKIFGVDQIRYFLLREIPLGNDGIYNYSSIIKRINSDLSNNLGNLIQRTLIMINKYCKQKIPNIFYLINKDKDILSQSKISLEKSIYYMENESPNFALEEIFLIISNTNRYFSSEEPWKIYASNKKRFYTIIYVTVEVLKRIGIILIPFMPKSSNKLLDLLSISKEKRKLKYIYENSLKNTDILPIPEIIFPKINIKYNC